MTVKFLRRSEWRQSGGENPSRIVLIERTERNIGHTEYWQTHRFATALEVREASITSLWGHYDLTESEALTDFESRSRQNSIGRTIVNIDS